MPFSPGAPQAYVKLTCWNKGAARDKIGSVLGSIKEVSQGASKPLSVGSHIVPVRMWNFLSDELAKWFWLLFKWHLKISTFYECKIGF